MAKKNSSVRSDVWRLDSTQATLSFQQLTAGIDLLNPRSGLSKLVYKDTAFAGSLLGVVAGTKGPLSTSDLSDAFVRGNDLVATYAETNERPFSLQVYWRATIGPRGALLLDSILSLQTDLLESFPSLAVETNLAAATVWQVPATEKVAAKKGSTEINLSTGQQNSLSTHASDALVFRPFDGNWSYAEMTYPEDRGEGQLQRIEDDSYVLRRQLGGSFLEKGVIRRLRVRGAFLTRENDFDQAQQCLAKLATEQPPLTV